MQINADRDKVEEAASDVAERQQQFRRDRAELEQWFAAREEQHSSRTTDSVVQDQAATIHMLQTQIVELQNRWHKERLEAEHAIRDLLSQITSREVGSMESTADSGNNVPSNIRDAA